MIPEEMKQLPKNSVISVIGAGGKTTAIHVLAEEYRRRGRKVLVTTTTHMLLEEPLAETEEEIREALRHGYAFAGTPVENNGIRKISSLPETVLFGAIRQAEITMIEADGASCHPFKAPKSTEPVICPKTTHILLSAGMKAVGEKIGESCYNAEAVCEILGKGPEEVLTPEDMGEVYRRTYLARLKTEAPGIPVTAFASQDETPDRRAFAERYLHILYPQP